MKLLHFKPRDTEEEVPRTLTHLSISIHPTGYRITEELGLDERMTTVDTKEELFEYLKEIL